MSDLGPQLRRTISALERILDFRHPALNEIIRIFSSFRNKLNTFATFFKAHWGKIGTVTLGSLLIANPVALLGFGVLGPVAGSIAAGWQATMGGYIASGSLFAGLQSFGMTTASVVLPAIGGVLLALFLICFARKHRKELKDAATRFRKWVNGDYGDPVSEWWNDRVGNPVARWWNDTFGKTVRDKAAEEKRKKLE